MGRDIRKFVLQSESVSEEIVLQREPVSAEIVQRQEPFSQAVCRDADGTTNPRKRHIQGSYSLLLLTRSNEGGLISSVCRICGLEWLTEKENGSLFCTGLMVHTHPHTQTPPPHPPHLGMCSPGLGGVWGQTVEKYRALSCRAMIAEYSDDYST
jgi:hypothetical protein